MPKVTGTLRDFNIASLAAYSPRIIFTASSAATTSTRIYATKPIIVTPNLGGDFEVFLQASDTMNPIVWYTVRVEWLDADSGYVGVDLPDWKLFVPSMDSNIGDILDVPANPALAWVSLDPPLNPTPGLWWLKVNPDDPTDPRNTGELLVWE